jgi:acyl carrier protein
MISASGTNDSAASAATSAADAPGFRRAGGASDGSGIVPAPHASGTGAASGSDSGSGARSGSSDGTSLLARIVECGIRPARGPEALDRVLRSDLGPVVVVSSIDFATLRRAARASFARPAAVPVRAPAGAKPAAVTFSDPIQQAVAEVWQDVLGVTNVGLDDDFMDLGGHSLMAVRVATRLQRRFGGDLKLAALLEARTVRALAAAMRALTGDQPATSPTPKAPTGPGLRAVSREAFRVSRASLATDD